jgi:3-oxoacyl-[acyl-carrier protein] reductase
MGRGCALAIARRGADVVITGRDPDALAETVAELEAIGSRASSVRTDVADPKDLEAAFAHVDQVLGRLDALVVHAGSPPRGPFLTIEDADWEVGYQLTLMSAIRSIRQAVERMDPARGGRIVLIGSSNVRRPIPNLTVSNVMRPALNGLVRSLAVELAPSGITINMVSPGRIDTDHARRSDEGRAAARDVPYEQVRREFEASIPMGRYGSPDELGALVGFLASPEASYVTGQSLLVDGGQVATLP